MFYLSAEQLYFPPVHSANIYGLVAIGGDLSPQRLILAYQSGIFPWYDKPPIRWYSPEPRFVLFPDNLKVAKSMRSIFNQKKFEFSVNKNFEAVIRNCAKVPREGQNGTWINADMIAAYIRLHQLGYAHSIETWHQGVLVGGLYGIILGKVFFGESMFSHQSNASKAAFIVLVKNLEKLGFSLIDCQVYTAHLESLGAELIPRTIFMDLLAGVLGEKLDLASYFESDIKIF